MSSSFVPKVKMSKGASKKTKFDVSCNTHTTAEVGYLQPTFSKLLMPNSDLTIKSHDSILLSSLVVPTFGDLSLRSWYMATPVSSLWTPLGCFLSQRECVDSDDNRGYSVPEQMPRTSMMSLLHYLISVPTYNVAHQDAYYLATPDLLAGNLTYAFHRSGAKRTNLMLSFDELFPDTIKNSIFGSFSENDNFDSDVAGYFNSLFHSTRYPMTIQLDGNYDPEYNIEINTTSNYYANYKRYSSVFPWWATGLVIRNSDSLRNMLTKKLYDQVTTIDGVTTLGTYTEFPSPSECPYVVVFVRQAAAPILPFADYTAISETEADVNHFYGGLEFIPLTNKMFQGDINPDLYRNGWLNDVQTHSVTVPAAPSALTFYVVYHPTGQSRGWSLGSDDSYFTGDLGANTFDFCAYQCNSALGGSPAKPTNDKILFYACGTWSRRFKRLRKMFIGFGDQFNPFDSSQFTPWKLFAYYKSWFDNFHPKRDMQYYQTPLARLSNYLSYHGNTWKDDFISVLLELDPGYSTNFEVIDFSLFNDFSEIVFDCADAKYLMPLDYFTLADIAPLGNDNTSDENINTPLSYFRGSSLPDMGSSEQSNEVSSRVAVVDVSSGSLNAWAIKMADKMLSYLTKKRVVGKSVSDTMRALFGSVDEHDKAHEATWCFGTSSTPINISAVMSTAETEEMHLGDYAGRGLGGSSSRQFRIDNNADLLVVLVMSAIVPRLGYYQGNLRENSIGTSPNEFCKSIYDAVGYEDVYASEYIADIVHYDDNSPLGQHPGNRYMRDLDGKSLGLVPRFTWYKIARDCVNGDMSLPSTQDSMSPYVMTRDVDRGFSIDPLEMRTVDPDSFNKIFNESSSLDDHFIIQVGYSVDLYAPLKSLSTSFDDFDVDEDGTIEVEHA